VTPSLVCQFGSVPEASGSSPTNYNIPDPGVFSLTNRRDIDLERPTPSCMTLRAVGFGADMEVAASAIAVIGLDLVQIRW
jgi:hypothetical protein